MTDGHIRVGNTHWHGIAAEESPPCETLRVCFYFTALNEDNGCVRSSMVFVPHCRAPAPQV